MLIYNLMLFQIKKRENKAVKSLNKIRIINKALHFQRL